MTQIVSDEQYGRASKKAHELVRRIAQGTLPFDLMMDLLQEIIEGKRTPKYPVKYYYPIPVDPTMLLTALLRSAGYDESMVVGTFTDENFPSWKAEPKEIKFAVAELPNCWNTNHMDLLAGMGLRPANLRETIAFQVKFPEAQGQRNLYALDVYEKKDPRNVLATRFYNACFRCFENMRRGLELHESSSRNIREETVFVAAVCE